MDGVEDGGLARLGLVRVWLDPSMALMPYGTSVLSLCIQNSSLASLISLPSSESGLALISSRTCMERSSGECPLRAKCRPTLVGPLALAEGGACCQSWQWFMSFRCCLNHRYTTIDIQP